MVQHDLNSEIAADPQRLHEAIRRRAEQIFERSGKIAGRDIENWMQAEREILAEAQKQLAPRPAVVVRINGVRYVGEYARDRSEGYAPGEFAAGEQISVRFEGEKMFVKLRSGRELETTVVDRTSC